MPRSTRWSQPTRNRNWIGRTRGVIRWAARSYLVLIILGIIVGLQVAPVLSNVTSVPDDGTVAVIPVHGGIDGPTVSTAVAQLRQARDDPSIEAVVIHVNSGGGGASSSQELYLAVKKTAEEVPVVAVADAAALSGGYHVAVGADEIIVKPGTLIGNVGVVLTLPQETAPLDTVVATGPDKLTGSDTRGWYYKTEVIKRSFVSAVMTNRGDRLSLSEAEVEHGTIYTGAEAVSNGIADRYGTTEDGIDRAATLASLSRYDVMVMEYGGTVQFITQSAYVASDAPEKTLISPTNFTGIPGETSSPTVVMIPPSVIHADYEVERPTAIEPTPGVNVNATTPT